MIVNGKYQHSYKCSCSRCTAINEARKHGITPEAVVYGQTLYEAALRGRYIAQGEITLFRRLLKV